MKCRTCASNFAAETAPRDIETLIGIILPLKKYRCRGCYTRSWHTDRKLLRTPRVIFWIPFWTFFIYGLVKGITNESYEIAETTVTGRGLATNENAAPNLESPTVSGPLKSFGEILENADANRSPTITVTAIETETSGTLVTDVTDALAAEPVELLPESISIRAADAPDTAEKIEELAAESTLLVPKTTTQLAETTAAPVDEATSDNTIEPVSTAKITVAVAADDQQQNLSSITNQEEINSGREELWIFEQEAELFTLQIGSYKSLDSPESAASALALSTDPLLKHQQSSDGKWYYLLYGAYKTAKLAEAASETLNLTEPWIRSFENLQKSRCKTVEANSEEASYCTPK